MLVVSFVGVVAALLAPFFLNSLNRSNDLSKMNHGKMLFTESLRYYDDNGEFAPSKEANNLEKSIWIVPNTDPAVEWDYYPDPNQEALLATPASKAGSWIVVYKDGSALISHSAP